MRIDIPINGFGRAGGYRVISRLATEWKRMGHEVRVLSTEASIAPYFPTDAEVVWLSAGGVRVESNRPALLKEQQGPFRVAAGLFALSLGLSRYSRSSDVILASHSLTAWPVLCSITMAKKFYYIQAYEPEFYECSVDGRRRVLEAQAWLSYLLPLHRIVNAPVYLDYRNLSARSWVPPGVDLSVFKPREHDKLPQTGVLTMACIGRREPDKGTRYVLEAFSILRAENSDIRLLVAYGNLPDGTTLEGIEVVVPTNDSELADFYRSADVIVAPAIGQHGAPHYPVIEAMACGIPVITTGYLPATPGSCWLVPERDPVAIADAVRAICADPSERNRRVEAALAIVRSLEWSEVAKRFVRFFGL